MRLWTADSPEGRARACRFMRSRGVHLTDLNYVNAIGLVDSARHIAACVAYTDFMGRLCTMHLAARAGLKHWCTREFLWTIFDYPFVQCDLLEVLAWVPVDNYPLLRMLRRLRFLPRYTTGDGALVLFSLRRGLLPQSFTKGPQHGQIEQAAACA